MEIINKIWKPIRNWYLDNWNSPRLFDKGTVIFVSVVGFFLLVKLISKLF